MFRNNNLCLVIFKAHGDVFSFSNNS